MPDPRTIQACRWAEPTVFLPTPLWTAAENFPWSCNRDGAPRVVQDTTACLDCPRWEGSAVDGPVRRIPVISGGW
jgi:hypothetical protein